MARLAPVLVLSLLMALSFSTWVAAFAEGTSAAVDPHEALQRVRELRRTAHAKALESTQLAFRSMRRQAAVEDGPLSPACQNLALQMATSNCLLLIPSGTQPGNASDVEELCSSCITPLKQFVQQCMPPSQQFIAELLDLMCTTSDGVYCGIQFSMASACASEKNATVCAANADCRVNPSDGLCETRPSILCRPCSQNYLRFIARVFGGGESSELSDFVCVQSQDGYCLDVLPWFNTTTTSASLPAMLDATICNQANLSQRVCWSKLSVAVSRLNQHLADQAYSSCIVRASVPAVAQKCVDTWRYASFAAWSVSKATDVVCRLSSAGQSCAQVLAPPSTAFATCLTTASVAKTCTAQCNAEVNQTVTAAGCCVGFLADLRSAVLPGEFAMMQPSGPIPAGIRPTTPPPGVPSNPWAPLKACPSTINISQTINETCPYDLTSLKAVRRLQLRIRWTYLANNETLRQLIFDALQRDLTTAVGLTATDLAEFNVTEDGSLVLDAYNGTNASGTSHRRMLVQAATTSGAQVTLGIQTNNDAYTNGLASSFDVELAAQTVNLPTTQAALQAECPQCAADPNGSLIVPPSPSSESSNVGLIVGLVIAGVLVVLLVGALIVFRVKRRQGDAEYRKIDDELR